MIGLGLRGGLVQRPGKFFSNGSAAEVGETKDATLMKRSPLAKVQLPPVVQSADNIRPPKAMRSSAPPIVAIIFLTGISFLEWSEG